MLTCGMTTGILPPMPVLVPPGGPVQAPGLSIVIPKPTGGLAPYQVSAGAAGLSQPINLGQGQQLTFDPTTMQGVITPALAQSAASALATLRDGGMMSFSGSECRVMIESAIPFNAPIQAGNAMPGMMTKQLLELTTLTVSIHRAKCQVAAGGYINPKGIARGRRTIAGTMIMTKFTT